MTKSIACLGFKSYAVFTFAILKGLIYAGNNSEASLSLIQTKFRTKESPFRPSNNAMACTNDGSPNSSVTTLYVSCLTIIYGTSLGLSSSLTFILLHSVLVQSAAACTIPTQLGLLSACKTL